MNYRICVSQTETTKIIISKIQNFKIKMENWKKTEQNEKERGKTLNFVVKIVYPINLQRP